MTDLLRRLTDRDPWTHSREGLDDHCLFCDSSDTTFASTASLYRWWHKPSCPWIAACRQLGIRRPGHYIKYLPANPYRDTCGQCDDDEGIAWHHKHTDPAYIAARAAEDEAFLVRVGEIGWFRAMTEAYPTRPMADYLPTFTAPRGGFTFSKPLDLTDIRTEGS